MHACIITGREISQCGLELRIGLGGLRQLPKYRITSLFIENQKEKKIVKTKIFVLKIRIFFFREINIYFHNI